MQGEVSCLAGKASGQGEEASPEGPRIEYGAGSVAVKGSPNPMRVVQRTRLWAMTWMPAKLHWRESGPMAGG